LSQHRDCTIQIGGSDQWGNITVGVELTRRMSGKEIYGITSVLLTKSDGAKFGKTESGNVWLDAKLTSPYKFYQYWMNISDEDVKKCIRIFTLLKKEEIELIESDHAKVPQQRLLQKVLAKEITCRVHSLHDYEEAVRASQFLFGNADAEMLKALSDRDFIELFENVPSKKLSRDLFENGIDLVHVLADETNFFPSRSEARRTILSNGVSVNMEPAPSGTILKKDQLIHNRYLLLQKGKKNFFLVIAE
jgi:tyrosyl-tRNA synthetase